MDALPLRRRRGGARWALVWVAAAAVGAGWGNAPRATTAPQESTPPTVAGLPLVGQTLTASPGLWTGALPIAFQYQWQRCTAQAAGCVPIDGAVGQSYQLSPEDAGATVRVQVGATNAAGATSALSGTTGSVAASPPADAVELPGGGLSVPAADVVAPDRLLLGSVRYQPVKPLAGHPFSVRVSVGDTAGYAIAGALVTVTALPYGLYGSSPEAVSDEQGTANLTVQPTPLASLQPSLTPGLLVQASVPGATAATAVSAETMLPIPLAAPTTSRTAQSPYAAEARGYDVSYPDCKRPRAPQPGFAVLGVNGGRPFTFNPCLGREHGWYAAGGPQAVYLNTGYEQSYRRHITPACALAARALRGREAQAFAIGCSEAATSLERVTLLGLATPGVWWLDVETSNSWSSDRRLNTQALRGMMAFLDNLSPTPIVGIYSRPSWWHAITAEWKIAAPEWSPSRSGGCPTPFSAGPVWLAQKGGATLDLDTAC